MSLYETYSTDKNLESGAGVILDFGASGKLRIHRAGGSNKKFGRVLEGKLKPYRRQIENGTMDNAVADRLLAEAYAEAVVLELIDVPGPDGDYLPSTPASVVKLFTDLPEFFREVQEQAQSVANFRAEQIAADKEAVKNV